MRPKHGLNKRRKEESKQQSIRQFTANGKIDQLYLCKYIPFRERKLIRKLHKTRAIYNGIWNEHSTKESKDDGCFCEERNLHDSVPCEGMGHFNLKLRQLCDPSKRNTKSFDEGYRDHRRGLRSMSTTNIKSKRKQPKQFRSVPCTCDFKCYKSVKELVCKRSQAGSLKLKSEKHKTKLPSPHVSPSKSTEIQKTSAKKMKKGKKSSHFNILKDSIEKFREKQIQPKESKKTDSELVQIYSATKNKAIQSQVDLKSKKTNYEKPHEKPHKDKTVTGKKGKKATASELALKRCLCTLAIEKEDNRLTKEIAPSRCLCTLAIKKEDNRLTKEIAPSSQDNLALKRCFCTLKLKPKNKYMASDRYYYSKRRHGIGNIKMKTDTSTRVYPSNNEGSTRREVTVASRHSPPPITASDSIFRNSENQSCRRVSIQSSCSLQLEFCKSKPASLYMNTEYPRKVYTVSTAIVPESPLNCSKDISVHNHFTRLKLSKSLVDKTSQNSFICVSEPSLISTIELNFGVNHNKSQNSEKLINFKPYQSFYTMFATGYQLDPYECEPGTCTPGECDPYVCYQRIMQRGAGGIQYQSLPSKERKKALRVSSKTDMDKSKKNVGVNMKNKNNSRYSQYDQNLTDKKSSSKPLLKRCFCTLKLFNKNEGTSVANASRATLARGTQGQGIRLQTPSEIRRQRDSTSYMPQMGVINEPISEHEKKRLVSIRSDFNIELSYSKEGFAEAGDGVDSRAPPVPGPVYSRQVVPRLGQTRDPSFCNKPNCLDECVKNQRLRSGLATNSRYYNRTATSTSYECDPKVCEYGKCNYKCPDLIKKNKTSESYNRTPENYNRTPETYDRIPENYDRTPMELDQYECEPGTCVPGKCNPVKCADIIRKRFKQKQQYPNLPPKRNIGAERKRYPDTRNRGISADFRRDNATMTKRGYKPTKVIEHHEGENKFIRDPHGNVHRVKSATVDRNHSRAARGSRAHGFHDEFGGFRDKGHYETENLDYGTGRLSGQSVVQISSAFSIGLEYKKSDGGYEEPQYETPIYLPGRDNNRNMQTRDFDPRNARANNSLLERCFCTLKQPKKALQSCFCTRKLQKPNDQYYQ